MVEVHVNGGTRGGKGKANHFISPSGRVSGIWGRKLKGVEREPKKEKMGGEARGQKGSSTRG